MRLPSIVVIHGFWFVGFADQTACLGILGRDIDAQSKFMLFKERASPKRKRQAPSETETEFFFRCDNYMYQLTVGLEGQKGRRTQELVYVQVNGNVDALKQKVRAIDPLFNEHADQWLDEHLKMFLDARVLFERLSNLD